MDIWITWAKRTVKCADCGEPITPGTPKVKGKQWRRGEWTKYYHWHPQCWINQGMAKLQKTPYQAGRLGLNEDQRKARRLLLCRWATIKYRLKKAVDKYNFASIERLLEQLKSVREEIKLVGGVPKSWQ